MEKEPALLENMGWLEASPILKVTILSQSEWRSVEPFNCVKVFVAYASYVGFSRISKTFEFNFMKSLTAD